MSASRERLERLAWWLDNAIRVPFTSRRVGFDGFLGLIPGVGDLVAGSLSGYILLQGLKHDVPVVVLLRMVFNVVFESLLGTVPLVGDLFDFGYKSNHKNVQLMQEYLDRPESVSKRSAVGVALLGILLLGVLVVSLYAVFRLVGWLFQLVF